MAKTIDDAKAPKTPKPKAKKEAEVVAEGEEKTPQERLDETVEGVNEALPNIPDLAAVNDPVDPDSRMGVADITTNANKPLDPIVAKSKDGNVRIFAPELRGGRMFVSGFDGQILFDSHGEAVVSVAVAQKLISTNSTISLA